MEFAFDLSNERDVQRLLETDASIDNNDEEFKYILDSLKNSFDKTSKGDHLCFL